MQVIRLLSKVPSPQQVLTFGFVIVQQLTMVIYADLFRGSSPIVGLCMFAWHSMILPVIVYETYVVSSTDTRDPLLRGANTEDYPHQDIVFCVLCGHLVLRRSYHCWRCKNCVDEIDHHCLYLNCCVSEKNYQSFLRLVAIFFLYSLNLSFFLVYFCHHNTFTVIVWILTTAQAVLSLALFIFHLYINLEMQTSTFSYIKQRQQRKPENTDYVTEQLQEVSCQINRQEGLNAIDEHHRDSHRPYRP